MANDPFVARLRVLDVCDLSDAIDALGMTPAVTGLILTSGARTDRRARYHGEALAPARRRRA